MSTTVHTASRRARGQRPPRRERTRTAPALPRPADPEELRILDLLRRGAGVTQILSEIGEVNDSPSERLLRANRLRVVLENLPDGEGPRLLSLPPRKLARTLAYLAHRLDLIRAEVEWTQHGRQQPLATDSYGVQVQIHDGLPSFTMVGLPDRMEHVVGEDLRKRLASLWPQRRITVVTPRDWTPHENALHALAHAIHVENTY
jgi:hypothetical protein